MHERHGIEVFMKAHKRILLLLMSAMLVFQPGLKVLATEADKTQESEKLTEKEQSKEEENDESETSGEDEESTEDEKAIEEKESEEDEEQAESDESQEDSETSEEDEELKAYVKEAQESLKEITDQNIVMALVYLCDTYKVKDAPGVDASTCVKVPTGTTVQITGAEVDEEWNVWYQVTLAYEDKAYRGYIDRSIFRKECKLCGCGSVPGLLSGEADKAKAGTSKLDFCKAKYRA